MFKRWLIAATAIAVLFCSSAFADSVDFTFSGTDALGDTINFSYAADPADATGSFTIFAFLNGATCTISNGAQCVLVEIATGSVNTPDGLADQLRVAYAGNPDNLFWFPLKTLNKNGDYLTLASSPGTAEFSRVYNPTGTPDGGDDPSDVPPVSAPEPGTLALLLAAIPLTGSFLKRASSSV